MTLKSGERATSGHAIAFERRPAMSDRVTFEKPWLRLHRVLTTSFTDLHRRTLQRGGFCCCFPADRITGFR